MQLKQPPGSSMPDPYRIFFPLGCAFGAWGVALWLAFNWGRAAYPGAVHADLMIGGFLVSFAIGFLLTAVPRFTGTARVTGTEMLLIGWPLAVLGLAAAGAFGRRGELVDHAAIALTLALLMSRLAPRYITRRQEPPPTFPIVGVGLMIGLLGAALMAAGDAAAAVSPLSVLGRLWLLHGFMPALVLGVGGRLFPVLLNGAPAPLQEPAARPATSLRLPLSLAFVFAAGFPLEAFGWLLMGRLIEAAAATAVAFLFWRLYRWPARRGVQPVLLWLAAWAFIAGLWGYALFPAYSLQALHLTFIGGLGLTTLAVATRVVLSHGGFDLAAELTSKALLGAGFLMLLSMGARVLAGVISFDYMHELAVAAVLWLAAMLLWSGRFLPAMLRRHKPAR